MRQKQIYYLQFDNHTYDVGDLVYMTDSSTKIGQSKKLQKPWIGLFVVTGKLSPVLYRIKNRRKERVVHHDRLKRCSKRDTPIWLIRLRHTVMTDVTHSEQEEEDEEDEDVGYLDNLYGDHMVSIPSQNSNAFGGNSKASSVSTSDVKVNSKERRHVRPP